MNLTTEQITQLFDVLGRLLGFLALIGGAIVYALKARADSRVKLDTAQATLITAKAAESTAKAAEQTARAEVLKLEAEARVKDADNTGRMITTLGKDREQIDALISHAKARIAELEETLRKTKQRADDLEAGLTIERDRVIGMSHTITGLLVEIETLRKSIDSGGAYPPGPEACPHCGKSLFASTTVRMSVNVVEDDKKARIE